ncbi:MULTISPECIES: xanthine dehydrogenase family protein subunit M [unclassified Polynucleobacter]|uniref:FAD binding domain-containing protein n=1 Tax=unclassified Polynucleobacter TaxID=2640945 RepID=UPI001BFD1862|nr:MULTISPECIES: xanthine dehydrogenase family protein subunit M [unclassified Polynucleobacter]MEA9604345.1 xanthine dehydrogenase family protein subunit M [Polynucleobacter sp. JS-JIR-II-c23]QWE03116.1 xanthine dehydrogenase family protein subunit M [Polynucleobacter sp. JS-JIR-II-b4]
MKSAAFDYVKPKALQEALSLLEQGGDDAQLIAGGQTLLATLNMRLSEPTVLIDITDIAELKGISVVGDSLRIGALVTHTEIEDSELVAKHAPLLKAAAPHIAHRAIRNLGTWGGSLAYGDPAAEWPACSLTLRATMIIHGPAGERRISANDFFIDLYTTSLEPDEILVATEIPLASKQEVFYFHELARRHGDYAVAGLAAVAQKQGDVLTHCAFTFFSVGATPVMATKAQDLINGQKLNDELIAKAVAEARNEIEAIADITNSAEAKQHLIGVLLERGLKHMIA